MPGSFEPVVHSREPAVWLIAGHIQEFAFLGTDRAGLRGDLGLDGVPAIAALPGVIRYFRRTDRRHDLPPDDAKLSICFYDRQQVSFDFFFGKCADQPVDHFTVLEQQHGGNALDRILGSDHGIFIHVEFRNLHAAGVFMGQLVENGGHRPAGCAPRRPAIHEDRAGGGNDFLGKGCVRHIDRAALIASVDQRGGAFTTFGAVIDPILGHAVFGPAIKATNDHFIQRGLTLAAGRLVLQALPGNAIFRSAVKTADNHLLGTHGHTQKGPASLFQSLDPDKLLLKLWINYNDE